MFVDTYKVVHDDDAGVDDAKDRLYGTVEETRVEKDVSRNTVELDLGDSKVVMIQGTSAELFQMCKAILDEIYKDLPMQRAVARANLIED